MKYDAVVDQIEEGKAVILVESIGKEFIVEKETLPEGAEAGSWLVAQMDGEKLMKIELNIEKTEARRREITDQLNRLRKKSKGSKFQRRN